MAPVLPSLSLAAPALIATARGALWRAVDGTIERLKPTEAVARAVGTLPLVCHAPAVAARLGVEEIRARDLLELFAFVRPATFCLPTPRGLCEALDVALPTTPEEEVASLREIARSLLDELEDMAAFASADFQDVARAMARGNWSWGGAALAALGLTDMAAKKTTRLGSGLDVWRSLPPWEEPPRPPAAIRSSRARPACAWPSSSRRAPISPKRDRHRATMPPLPAKPSRRARKKASPTSL
jgi:ATP-dependent DNA helicase DinG